MAKDLSATLNGFVIDAIRATLESGQPKLLDSAQHEELLSSWSDDLPVCIIGFSAAGEEFSGSLLLCCENDFLEATCPRQWTKKDELMDWLGEMANLTLGRFKTALRKYDIDLQLNPPSVSISSVSMLANYSERHSAGIFWFEVEGGTRLCAQFGADTEGLVLEEAKGRATGLDAGGSVLNMNPIKKKKKPGAAPSPLSATKAPSARPASGGIGFGAISLVEQRGDQLIIGFASGAQVALACETGSASRTLKLGDQTLKVQCKADGGIEVAIDPFTFFIPRAA